MNEDRIVVPCPRQTARLLQISFIAQLTQLVSPLIGWYIDRYSAASAAMAMAGIHTLGLLTFILGIMLGIPALLHVGFCLVAIHTWIGGMLCVHTGLYFRGRRQIIVTSTLNSLFDTSSAVYLGLWALYENVWKNLEGLLWVYFGLSVVIYSTGVFFWATAEPEEDNVIDDRSSNADEDQDAKVVDQDVCNVESSSLSDSNDAAESPTHDEVAAGVTTVSGPAATEYTLVAQRTELEQLTSGYFLALLIFFSIHVVHNQWHMTTVRDFLAELGDNEYDNRYLTYVLTSCNLNCQLNLSPR